MLQDRNGVAVVGIGMADKLPAGGPVRDKVARGNQVAGYGSDKEDGQCKRQPRDNGNRNFSEAAPFLRRGKIQLVSMEAILR